MAYIRGCNLKIFCLCQYTKQTAVGNGANPAKSIPQKRKRKRRDAPFMRPDTGKRPRKPKRNREFPRNSLSLLRLFTIVSPPRYFDRHARIRSGVVSFSCSGPVGQSTGHGASIRKIASRREQDSGPMRRIQPRNHTLRAILRRHPRPFRHTEARQAARNGHLSNLYIFPLLPAADSNGIFRAL